MHVGHLVSTGCMHHSGSLCCGAYGSAWPETSAKCGPGEAVQGEGGSGWKGLHWWWRLGGVGLQWGMYYVSHNPCGTLLLTILLDVISRDQPIRQKTKRGLPNTGPVGPCSAWAKGQTVKNGPQCQTRNVTSDFPPSNIFSGS